MAAFWLYSSVVALLLSIAGMAIERIAAWRHLPRRGIWALTLMVSIAFPAATALLPRSAAVLPPPPVFRPVVSAPSLVSSTSGAVVPRSPAVFKAAPVRWSDSIALPSFDSAFRILWMAMSGIVFAVLTISWGRIHRSRRQWQCEWVGGHRIWVTPALGPAVTGLFRPRILVPRWILEAPATTRSLVLTHETEHIRARDPLLLLAGLLAVLVAPWNLPLWWQLRRLRFALEVDCDARVLGRGADLQIYGQALLAVNQHSAVARFAAMAIGAPMSQLERRVRIMASAGRRPARWLIGAAVGLAAACAALAVNLQAPTLADVELRKPPTHDWSPYLPMAEDAARAAYPELFQGHFEGTVVLTVNLNRTGAILDMRKRVFPPGPLADDALQFDNELVSDIDRHPGNANRKFLGWFGPRRTNGLYMYYQVLKWPHDPSRSAARVRAAVAVQYPEFFRAYPPSQSHQNDQAKLLTVFMNDDGTINRAAWSDDSSGDDEKHRFNRFIDLGLSPDQFGHRGWTTNFMDVDTLSRYPNAQMLSISYAWPRRPDDPPDLTLQSWPAFRKWTKEQERQASDAAFLKHYFPDIWEHGASTSNDLLWILADHDGIVCDHGVDRNDVGMGVGKELERRYPGARIWGNLFTFPPTAHGSSVNMAYLVLQDDSPLTSCDAIASVRHVE